jgi:hypothetical protein
MGGSVFELLVICHAARIERHNYRSMGSRGGPIFTDSAPTIFRAKVEEGAEIWRPGVTEEASQKPGTLESEKKYSPQESNL